MTTMIEIPVAPPLASFLTTTRPIRTTWADGSLHEGWARGTWPDFVQWVPECGIEMGTWPKCIRTVDCDGNAFTETPKKAGSPPDSPVAIPFWIHAAERCSTWGYLTGAQHQARVERALEARASYDIARVTETGLVNGGEQCFTIDGVSIRGISLSNSAQIVAPKIGALPIDGYTPTSLTLAIAGLLRNAADCGGSQQWTFHMPIEFLPILDHGGRVKRVGDHFLLFEEYPVIFDGGYTGQPPVVSAINGGPIPVAPAGSAWIYLTGPVYHAVSEWTNIVGVGPADERYGPADFESAQQNILEVRAEKLAVVAFDPCCVFAALVQFC